MPGCSDHHYTTHNPPWRVQVREIAQAIDKHVPQLRDAQLCCQAGRGLKTSQADGQQAWVAVLVKQQTEGAQQGCPDELQHGAHSVGVAGCEVGGALGSVVKVVQGALDRIVRRLCV